ncbi:MAG: hypothetical protein KF726_09600 [Anaerolineae bacterium]|nr:hypothetical protein [Anaerolineae bacterium]
MNQQAASRSILNSIRFRIVLLLTLMACAIFYGAIVGVQSTDDMNKRDRQMNAVTDQRTAIYQMALQIERLLNNDQTPAEISDLLWTLADQVQQFELIQTALRQGDSALGIAAIEKPEVLAVLDQLEQTWAGYKGFLSEFMAAPRDLRSQLEAEKHAPLSTQLSQDADNLVSTMNVIMATDRQQVLQSTVSVAGMVVVLFLILLGVLLRGLHALNNLAATATQFAHQNFKARANTKTMTEFAQVGEVLNGMASRIDNLVVSLEQRVAETQSAREQAERADKVKSAFLATMSHELRTPLNAVINFTKFVIRGVMGPVNERQVETLTSVVNSGKHLLTLINDVLDISKIESGSLNLFIEDDVNVKEIVSSVVETARGLLAEKPVELRAEIADDLPLIAADRQRILQVLLNIVSNACKFTANGHIAVRVNKIEDEIRLEVEDTGPGIAPEDQADVFLAFKQTESGLRTAGGTGLGMPISKSLVEAHGGSLWLESVVGKGSTFFVKLPLTAIISTPQPVAA